MTNWQIYVESTLFGTIWNHGGMLLLVKLHALAKACNFTKSNTPP